MLCESLGYSYFNNCSGFQEWYTKLQPGVLFFVKSSVLCTSGIISFIFFTNRTVLCTFILFVRFYYLSWQFFICLLFVECCLLLIFNVQYSMINNQYSGFRINNQNIKRVIKKYYTELHREDSEFLKDKYF